MSKKKEYRYDNQDDNYKCNLTLEEGKSSDLGYCLFCSNENLFVFEVKTNKFSFRICKGCVDKMNNDIMEL